MPLAFALAAAALALGCGGAAAPDEWTHALGASRGEAVAGGPLAVDAAGDVVVSGVTDRDVLLDGDSVLAPSRRARFVAKFDAAGELLWIERVAEGTTPLLVAVDPDGDVLVGGDGGVLLDGATLHVPFVMRLDAADGHERWVRLFDADADSGVQLGAIAVDTNDDVLVGGTFFGTTHFGSKTLSTKRGPNAFLARFEPDAGHAHGAQRIEGKTGSGITAIDRDARGLLLAGPRAIDVVCSGDFCPPTVQGSGVDGSDALVRLDASGSETFTGTFDDGRGVVALASDANGAGALLLDADDGFQAIRLDTDDTPAWVHAPNAASVAGAVDARGRFVLAGTVEGRDGRWFVARLSPKGGVDDNVGFAAGDASVSGAAVDAAGYLALAIDAPGLIATPTLDAIGPGLVVARLNPNRLARSPRAQKGVAFRR
ncbi:MAG TPA: hypothetical protein VHB21_18445 [Minicystis sp.]|nr:hypothetical protein [Minicystis sp.]